MEYQKIINLINNIIQNKTLTEIIDKSRGAYNTNNTNSQIKFKTTMLKTKNLKLSSLVHAIIVMHTYF